MATAAQTTANQANALRSTGPVTPQGKAASSRNATRHGLTASFCVLPHENADEFQELADALESEFSPTGEHETFLVREMARARWRLLRIERLEALAFEQALTDPAGSSDPDACLLSAISASGSALDKLERYAAAARRDYYRAHRELARTQTAQKKQKNEFALASLEQYLNAPIPDSWLPSKRSVQNEPNSRPANCRPQAVENLALRL